MRRTDALNIAAAIRRAAPALTDEQALDCIALYPKWADGIAVAIGDRYHYDGKLYKAVQAHTTQADWTPDATPALWTEISVEEWPQWKQPTGAQDAYAKGDKCSHNGKRWTSDVDSNVWEPGVYGWTEA